MESYVFQILSLVLMTATIIVTITIFYVNLKISNQRLLEQNRRQFFAEYTKRYQEIIMAMPDDIFLGTAKIDGVCLKNMQLYFDLCSEEFHLYQDGIIPSIVWKYWKEGMQQTMKLQIYHESWEKLSGLYNTDFYQFFEREILLTTR